MSADQTPLDVEAIRARLDATSPGMTVDVHDGGSTLRATGNTIDRAGFVGSIGDLVETFTGGNLGPVTATFVDDEDGQDATFALHAAADIRDLLDENARLNAELESLRVHNGVLVTEIRFQADRAERMRVERDRAINECDDWETKYAELSVERDVLRRALPAAPEMPCPPAEEAQERSETPGTGSGRGTGIAEPHGAQADLSLIPSGLIKTNPGIRGGEPCITGTRIPASEVAGYLADGATWDEIREMLPSLPSLPVPGEEA